MGAEKLVDYLVSQLAGKMGRFPIEEGRHGEDLNVVSLLIMVPSETALVYKITDTLFVVAEHFGGFILHHPGPIDSIAEIFSGFPCYGFLRLNRHHLPSS